MNMIDLHARDFVRVRQDHEDHTRAGKDGLVVDVMDGRVALIFCLDRRGNYQHTYCAGAEEWSLDELDPTSIDRYVPA